MNPQVQPEAATPATHMDNWLAREKAAADKALAKFKENLEINPAYAFEWADSAVGASAVLEVIAKIKSGLTAGKTWAEIKEWASAEVLQRACNMRRSTSSTSNLVDSNRLQAWASVLDAFKWQSV